MRYIANRPLVLSMLMILMILITGSGVLGATGEPDRSNWSMFTTRPARR